MLFKGAESVAIPKFYFYIYYLYNQNLLSVLFIILVSIILSKIILKLKLCHILRLKVFN